MGEWIDVDDRLPTKEDGWIGYYRIMDTPGIYYIDVLAVEVGGYGSRIRTRKFVVQLKGKWTMDNKQCEIVSGSFEDWHDWVVALWMPLPKLPKETPTRRTEENTMIWKRLVANINQCKDCAWMVLDGRKEKKPPYCCHAYEKHIENTDEIPDWCPLEDYDKEKEDGDGR